jgi:hypothetical protein
MDYIIFIKILKTTNKLWLPCIIAYLFYNCNGFTVVYIHVINMCSLITCSKTGMGSLKPNGLHASSTYGYPTPCIAV